MSLSFKHLVLILTGCFYFLNAHAEGAIKPVGDAKPIHEAFIPKFTDITPHAIVAKEPPPPLSLAVPPQPANDLIWIPGYWAWLEASNDYVWVCGVWRRPPPNHVWIAGNWINSQGGWVWARGFWSPTPQEKLVFIAKAPPASISDNPSSAPGDNYFWTPGYWNYQPASDSYGWLTGKWQQFNPDWVLAPASYIWRPNGYVFIGMYWDWPLEKRGQAFDCTGGPNALPVIIQPEVIYQNIYVYYPDYLIFYWHHWHFHPIWWNGCDCVPPWWFWSDWWGFSWGDSWGLWWWWGHPGAFPPFWLSLEISLGIAPPPLAIIELLSVMKKPLFDIKLGDKPLLPKGTPNGKTLPRPKVPSDITPIGSVELPTLPQTEVTLPPPPTVPQVEPVRPAPITPPAQDYYEPPVSYPDYEPPPSTYYPPDVYVPERPFRPGWYPPRHDHDRDHDHGRDHGRDHDRDHGKGDRYPNTSSEPQWPKPGGDDGDRHRSDGGRKTPNYPDRSGGSSGWNTSPNESKGPSGWGYDKGGSRGNYDKSSSNRKLQ